MTLVMQGSLGYELDANGLADAMWISAERYEKPQDGLHAEYKAFLHLTNIREGRDIATVNFFFALEVAFTVGFHPNLVSWAYDPESNGYFLAMNPKECMKRYRRLTRKWWEFWK